METFPAYARLLRDDYKQQRESGVQRSEMESGPPKQLQTVSRVLVTRPVVYRFASKNDFNNFITWFQSTIHFGADWFTWTDPLDAVAKSARIVSALDIEDPVQAGLAGWHVRFRIETWSG